MPQDTTVVTNLSKPWRMQLFLTGMYSIWHADESSCRDDLRSFSLRCRCACTLLASCCHSRSDGRWTTSWRNGKHLCQRLVCFHQSQISLQLLLSVFMCAACTLWEQNHLCLIGIFRRRLFSASRRATTQAITCINKCQFVTVQPRWKGVEYVKSTTLLRNTADIFRAAQGKEDCLLWMDLTLCHVRL